MGALLLVVLIPAQTASEYDHIPGHLFFPPLRNIRVVTLHLMDTGIAENNRLFFMLEKIANYLFGLFFYLHYLLIGKAIYPLPDFILAGILIRRLGGGKQALKDYLLVQTLWGRKLTRLQREFTSPHIHTYFGQKTPSFLSRVPTIRAHTSIWDQFSRT